MSESPLQTEVQYVKGVGPRRAPLYARLDIHTAEDLLWDLPRDVLDLTEVRSAKQLEEGVLVSVRGHVVDIDGKNISNGRTLTAVLIDAGDGMVRGSWFNQPWMLKRFDPGQLVLFSGKPKRRGGRWEINNPTVQYLNNDDDGEAGGGVLPRYRLTEGLRMEDRRAAGRAAVELAADAVVDAMPETFRETMQLPTLPNALAGVHTPQTLDDYKAGKRRLLFDDLFEFQLGLAIKRRTAKTQLKAPVLESSAKIDSRIRRLFPFAFTEGQNDAIREILADLKSGRAMHRLLQADVGAGKTVVALYGMLVTVAAGMQTALMAPTEVLAVQHWETVEQALQHSRVRRRLLTGQLTAAGRRDVLEEIRTGAVDLVVGTQALIQSDVRFRNLGLAVIDEQHKFGVMQRAHFALNAGPEIPPPTIVGPGEQKIPPLAKGGPGGVETNASNATDSSQTPPNPPLVRGGADVTPPNPPLARGGGTEDVAPHVLVMTATPIPRSLCLTMFGDLDITTIRELPPGRQKIVTSRIRGDAGRERVWDFLRKQLNAGRQAYVVCPRVEDVGEGDSELISAEAVYESLRTGEFADYNVGLVHGQMDRDLKNRAMENFRDGDTQLLVSTTVIEVGVDVPNATLMVVLQAERFGLSQLHQLRGRIGRGKFQGYCFLFSDSDSDDAGKRLWSLESTTDGFRIAETDFELRGPGDVLGTRQHGSLPLKVADIRRDAKILDEARKAAFQVVASGEVDTPDFAKLKQQVLARFGEWLNLPQTG